MNNDIQAQSNSQGTEMNKYDDEMIRGLFDNFIADGNKPSVTGFKKHLNELIDSHIKHLTTRSGKSGEANQIGVANSKQSSLAKELNGFSFLFKRSV